MSTGSIVALCLASFIAGALCGIVFCMWADASSGPNF
jgi:uncharacterized membrane protein YoaK (UPF0700 family)